MNPFQFKATCSVCGGDGVTDTRGNSAMWTGGTLSHRDPSICRDVLARRREEIDKLADKIKEVVGD